MPCTLKNFGMALHGNSFLIKSIFKVLYMKKIFDITKK